MEHRHKTSSHRTSHRAEPYISTKKCKLPNCDRPRYFDQDSGCLHDYCGRTHAKAAEERGIGRKLQPSSEICRLPGCTRTVYTDPDTGKCHDFCGRSHAKIAIEEGYWPPREWDLPRPQRKCGLPGSHATLAAERRLLAPATSGVERVWCGPLGDYSVSLLTRKHEKYDSIKRQFIQAWLHNDTRVSVQRILQIRNPPHVYERYRKYLAQVGNEHRRFHGTSMTCSFGTSLGDAPCNDAKCGVCNICQTGFNLTLAGSKTGFLRFGPGLYFSATASKSHSYNEGSARNGNHNKVWRAMFLCKVAVGNGYRTDGTVLITQPPNGYHSVIGEPGQALNYDEVVVYNDAAAIPSYLIVYSVAE